MFITELPQYKYNFYPKKIVDDIFTFYRNDKQLKYRINHHMSCNVYTLIMNRL